MSDIDNRRPDDARYPTAEPCEMSEELALVQVGQYVVNREGDIVIATTSNDQPSVNDFVDSLNRPYFRAKFIGCRDDYLEFANQCRLATAEEARRAREYSRGDVPVNSAGQTALF